MCVVGNKLDKNKMRQVGYKEATEFAISIGSLYHECSALNSEGIYTRVFQNLLIKLISLVFLNFNCHLILIVFELYI